MEKKSRIWIIVLAVLLAVTLALGVWCKLELDAANERYRTLQEETRTLAGQVDQLTEELDQAKATPDATAPVTQEPTQEPSAQPTEDTAAALTEELEQARQENQSLTQELDAARAERDATKVQLEEAQAQLAQAQADLESARSGHTDTTAALEAERAARTQAEDDLASAQAELTDAQAENEALQAELAAAQTELADTRKALEAYRLAFAGEGAEGSRYADTTMDATVQVASDGVTATYLLENTAASGNCLSFRLEVAGEEVFASEKLEPGQSVTTFQLKTPLTSGEYEGQLTVITYGKDAVASSKMTTPVTVVVE